MAAGNSRVVTCDSKTFSLPRSAIALPPAAEVKAEAGEGAVNKEVFSETAKKLSQLWKEATEGLSDKAALPHSDAGPFPHLTYLPPMKQLQRAHHSLPMNLSLSFHLQMLRRRTSLKPLLTRRARQRQ